MGIVIRESIKSTITSYAGVLIGTINVVLLYTNFLSPEQLGLTRVLQDTTLLFISIAQLGSPNLIIKFFPHFKNPKNNHNGFLFFTIFYTIVGFLFFTILFFILRDAIFNVYLSKSPLIVEYLFLIIPLGLGLIFMNIFESYIIVHSKVVFPTFMREVFIKLSNTFLIILFAFGVINFTQFLYFLILAYFIASLILLFYVKNLGSFSLRPNFSIFKSPKFKQMFSYGLFTLLGGIGYLLTTKIDIVMLPAYEGLRQTAVYTIAILIATLMEIPKRSLTQAVTSTLTFAIKENDNSKIKELYKKTSINLFIFGSILFLILWANIDDIFILMPKGEIYAAGKTVLFLFLIGRLLDLLSGINHEIILYSQYYKYSLVFMIFLGIITVITNLIFIPIYGILGAAVATLLSMVIYMLAKIIFVWIKFKIHPFCGSTLLSVLFFILMLFIVIVGNNSFTDVLKNVFNISNFYISSIINIIIRSLLLIATITFLFIKFNISEDFTNLVFVTIEKLKRYKS